MSHDNDQYNDGKTLIAGVLYDDESGQEVDDGERSDEITVYFRPDVTLYLVEGKVTGMVFDGGWGGDSITAEDDRSDEITLTDAQYLTIAEATKRASVSILRQDQTAVALTQPQKSAVLDLISMVFNDIDFPVIDQERLDLLDEARTALS